MPENWRHYIGIDLDNIAEAVARIVKQPELLPQIAAEGRTWAIDNYGPKATARRFLATVADIQALDLERIQLEMNLAQ